MPTLRIEHPVPNFDAWKKAFDSDPAGRRQSGVRNYQILRPVEDPNYVMIDLEFDTIREAEALLASMRKIWSGAGSQVSSHQRARIVETAETKEY
jgi:hypothetical protein